jgi:hypothetical protein
MSKSECLKASNARPDGVHLLAQGEDNRFADEVLPRYGLYSTYTTLFFTSHPRDGIGSAGGRAGFLTAKHAKKGGGLTAGGASPRHTIR